MSSDNSGAISIPYGNSLSRLSSYGNIIALASAFYAAVVFFYGFQFFSDKDVANTIWISQMLQAAGLPVKSNEALSLLSTLAFLPAICLVTLGSYARRHLCDTSIRITPDSIYFPPCFLLSLKWRPQRLWQDISHILVTGKRPSLVLYFQSGGSASLHTDRLREEDIEQLALIVEMRAGQAARRSPDLTVFLDSLHREKMSKGQLSFTQLWEEQINRDFSAPAFVPLEPGTSLGASQLKICRQLSFGGFSAIYLAQDQAGKKFVVKESAPPRLSNESKRKKAEEMLEKESRVLTQLSHPQIVKAHHYFKENGKTYLVLDYIPGENLRQIINSHGPADQSQAIAWTLQLSEIAAYLHSLNPLLIHRDISPDNIILGADEKLILIDFGAANEFIEQATGTLVGKQAYIAPEQFRGKATILSDVYSIGATLYFLLTGKDPLPFSQSHPAHENDSIIKTVDILVSDCTASDQKLRPQSVQEVLARLKDIAQSESLQCKIGLLNRK